MQIQKINRGPCCLYRRKVMLDPPVGPTSACWTLNSQIYVHSGLTWDHIIKKILFFQTMFFTGLLTVNAAAMSDEKSLKVVETSIESIEKLSSYLMRWWLTFSSNCRYSSIICGKARSCLFCWCERFECWAELSCQINNFVDPLNKMINRVPSETFSRPKWSRYM